MPRAKPQGGRDSGDVGAAIIAAWLKALPTGPNTGVKITKIMPGNPIKVDVQSTAQPFKDGDLVFFREIQGTAQLNDWTEALVVHGMMPAGAGWTFNPYTQGGSPLDGSSFGAWVKKGVVFRVLVDPTDNSIKNDLTYALTQLLPGTNVNVIFDQTVKGGLNVVVPRIPNGVFTRQGLLQYLQDFHDQAENRQYQEELGVAVLYGCR